MELNTRQRNILKEKKPSLGQRASQGDKVARHYLEELMGIGDYREEDMCDLPRGYVTQ